MRSAVRMPSSRFQVRESTPEFDLGLGDVPAIGGELHGLGRAGTGGSDQTKNGSDGLPWYNYRRCDRSRDGLFLGEAARETIRAVEKAEGGHAA
jgi:hypothetical protein